ncbi:MAG: hypothetical protein JO264_13280 [Acidisphaera sp.]|nr:hypothetical protein [Acidisphaera sp.]
MSGSLGEVRRPRLRVLANGAPVIGAQAADIDANNHFSANRFRVSVVLDADPTMGADFWAAQDDIQLDVQIGFLPDGAPEGYADWVSLVLGAVDVIEIEAVSGVLHLQGRDLTAALIETRTQETFSNRTASEIAGIIAGRHGLTASVTATATPVGRYYEIEHDRITLDQFSRATTEWDLLVWLAQQEGFDVWVQGTTLSFQPPQAAGVPAAVLSPTASVFGAANLLDLRLERCLTLAQNIQVTVKSWNSRQQNAFTQTASNGGSGKQTSYVLVRPNLTPDDALRLAQTRLTELSQHERVITATMPGELTLAPRTPVLLTGTGTAFDQVYVIDRIERQLRMNGGFTQRLRAKNASV